MNEEYLLDQPAFANLPTSFRVIGIGEATKEHLNHYIEYIKSNPIGFRADEYLLYVNGEYE